MRFHVGMSFRPQKYIKWIVLALLGIFGFTNIFAKAEVIDNYGPGGAYAIYANNTSIQYRWITVQSGANTDIRLAYQTPGNPLGCIPTNEGGSGCYVRYTLCVDSDVDSIQAVSSNVASITFSKTSTSCSYYNSSYTGGTIAYLDYWIDPVEVEDSLASVRYSNTIRLKFSSAVSIQSNQVEIQEEKFNISLGEVVDSINDNMDQNTNKIVNALNQGLIATNEVKDTLLDETPPQIDNSTFSDIDVASNTAISGLITMPITILQRLNNNLGDTCQPYELPFGLTGGNEKVTFPCINPEDYLGSTIWGYIDLFICFFMIYNIAMLIISSFESITSLEDTFASLYEPRHADTGYKPKHGGDD